MEIDTAEHYQRQVLHPLQNQQYSSRVPSPPRIIIPAPSNDLSSIIAAVMPPPFLPPGQDNYTVLEDLTTLPASWEYSDRHKAHMVLPYLYLGPMTITKDTQWLKEQGITMVLGVRSSNGRIMDTALTRARNLGLKVEHISAFDQAELMKNFALAHNLIVEHIQLLSNQGATGKVLVTCESGNDRSVAVVTAFLMEAHQDLDYIKAVQLVQSRRFCAMFSDDLKRTLQNYYDILIAKRMVVETEPRGGQKRQHRSDDGDEGVEIDMTDGHDRGHAPFIS